MPWFLIISINPSDIAIINIKCSGYGFIISLITKKEVIKLEQNADLTDNNGTL